MNEEHETVQELLDKLLKVECLKVVISLDESPNMVNIERYIAQADSLLEDLDPSEWQQIADAYDGTKE